MYFRYRGWLRLKHGQKSVVVILWAMSVKLLSGTKPLLYSYQSCLPRQHVPKLSNTVSKYLKTMKPLLSSEEYANLSNLGDHFQETGIVTITTTTITAATAVMLLHTTLYLAGLSPRAGT